VLLFELLTGTTPFEKERLHQAGYDEMRRIIREEEPPKPSARLSTMHDQMLSTLAEQRNMEPRKLSQQLRGELDWIVMKALEKDRNRRYESASALAADVQRYLQDEPVQACPPSLRYRVGKFLRKHRTGVLTAAALLAVALGFVASFGYVVLDRNDRLTRIEQQVAVALGGARTAIEAGDLTLARQRLAEAQGHLGIERERLPAQAADIDRVRKEVERRQADENRLRQFLKLASDGQDKMGRQASAGGDREAKKALDLYSVLEAKNWLARLDDSYLTADQKEQARETAYVTLVSLADWCLRWEWDNHDPERIKRSLDLLERAQTFHEPTRAFYFVRGAYHNRRKNTAEAEADVKRFQAAPARTAWDEYLPGHTAGWGGDLREAIRSYQAALRLQPDHFNSLFFLAMRFHAAEINRVPEAIQLYTACIALRPDSANPYLFRGHCYEQLGQFAEAEADYTVGKSKLEKMNPTNRNLSIAYCSLGHALVRQQKLTEAVAIVRKAVDLGDLVDQYCPARYDAAGVTVLAACSQGKDGVALDAKECAQLRGRALAWLRECLIVMRKDLEKEPANALSVMKDMQHWQQDTDFNGVRGDDALAKLPDAERREWRKLWEEVENLRNPGGFIQSWLVLSERVPYEGIDGAKTLDQLQIPGEALLRPRAGDRVEVSGKTLVWKEHHCTQPYIDFAALYGRPAWYVLAYAVCYVHADADRTDLVLRAGSDDQAKLYLNGKEVYRQPEARGLMLDQDEIPVTLRKGINVLVFKVVNQGGPGPEGSLHFVTKDGATPKGIEYRLTP